MCIWNVFLRNRACRFADPACRLSSCGCILSYYANVKALKASKSSLRVVPLRSIFPLRIQCVHNIRAVPSGKMNEICTQKQWSISIDQMTNAKRITS